MKKYLIILVLLLFCILLRVALGGGTCPYERPKDTAYHKTTAEQAKEMIDKDDVLLVHCRTGVRSKEASDKLVALGYTKVYDFGGIADWPYETESEEK